MVSLERNSKEISKMFDAIAPKYDFLNKVLSLRQDVRWRKALVRAIPQKPGGVHCDVACGTGDVLASVFQSDKKIKTFWGVDLSPGMLEQAKERKDIQRMQSALGEDFALVEGNAEKLPLPDKSVDILTISFGYRNVQNRERALQEFYRTLKPGGRFLMLEFFAPRSTPITGVFNFYMNRVLPKIGGLLSKKEAYNYLTRSLSTMPTTQVLQDQMEGVGFQNFQEKSWLLGSTRLVSVDKD